MSESNNNNNNNDNGSTNNNLNQQTVSVSPTPVAPAPVAPATVPMQYVQYPPNYIYPPAAVPNNNIPVSPVPLQFAQYPPNGPVPQVYYAPQMTTPYNVPPTVPPTVPSTVPTQSVPPPVTEPPSYEDSEDTTALLNNAPTVPSVPNTSIIQPPPPLVPVVPTANPNSGFIQLNNSNLIQVVPQNPNENTNTTNNEKSVKEETKDQNVVVIGIHDSVVPRGSARMRCPYCKKDVSTTIRYEETGCVWVSCILLFIFFILCPFCPCCCVPFCMNNLKDVVHYCPTCKHEIARRKRN